MNKFIKIIAVFFVLAEASALEQSKDFPISGPNCHDTALRELDLKKTRRYIHNHEMRRFLNERCEVVYNNGSKLLGIVELVDTGDPMHGFVSLEDGTVLTKDGVLKRTLPRITSLSEMKTIHTNAIKSHCRQKSITPCKVEVKYYNCRDVDISLSKVEEIFSSLTATKYSFYNLDIRNSFANALENEDSTQNCEKKKEELQSMVLAFRLANMSSRSREEQINGEEFFKVNFEYLNNISCN